MSKRTKSASLTNGAPTATAPSDSGELVDRHTLIPLHLIDEPAEPERETMEPEDLADLMESINSVGLIQPLTVKPKGDRFEVIAGHRRLLACRMGKYSPVPCIVKANGAGDHTAVLIHENAFREEINPVEEARFYDRLLRSQCHNDVDELVLMVRRRRNYVEDRLLLLQLPDNVLAALHQKRISLSVAKELGKVPDPNRLLILLDVSITQGATARQVAQWRHEAETMAPIGEAPESAMPPENQPQMVEATPTMVCFFCQDHQFPHMMEFLYLHKPCKAILDRMLARAQQLPQQGEG